MDIRETEMNGTAHTSTISTAANGIDKQPSILKEPGQTEKENNEEDPRNFTIAVYKKFKIRIYKPLIPLKLALFIWYGAGSGMATFVPVFVKQRGVTLSELSISYGISPVVHLIGITISGIIADKIGRFKPVMIVNILLSILIVIAMILVPNMKVENCNLYSVNINCHKEFGRTIANTSCDINKNSIELSSCNVTCPEGVIQYCNSQHLICKLLERNEYFDNISMSVHGSWTFKLKNECHYNVTLRSHENLKYSWCIVPHEMNCGLSCFINPEVGCSGENNGRNGILILNISLLIAFFTVFSISFRFLDVTSMALVKEHNSDLGRERFFGIIGVLVSNPLIGYIVDATTTHGSEKNYESVFYLFIAMSLLLLVIVFKLEVKINPPGKSMWKKSLHLLKNPDVLTFALVLAVLGTTWGFHRGYISWYLEGMNSPGILLGLLNSIGALYGMPFLLTSNWFIKKIGTTNIFVLGLLGYVANAIGYSLLYNPWLSLLIEVTCIVTYHLLWVSAIVHSHRIAPEGLTATVISTAGGIHYTFGRSFGGFVGGLIMNAYGGRIAFGVIAISCLISAVMYGVYLYVRRMCFTGSHTLDIKSGFENVAFENQDSRKGSYTMQVKP